MTSLAKNRSTWQKSGRQKMRLSWFGQLAVCLSNRTTLIICHTWFSSLLAPLCIGFDGDFVFLDLWACGNSSSSLRPRRFQFPQIRWRRIYAWLGNQSSEMSGKQTRWECAYSPVTEATGRDVGTASIPMCILLWSHLLRLSPQVSLLAKYAQRPQYHPLPATLLLGLCQHSATQKLWPYTEITFAPNEISKGFLTLAWFGFFLYAL